MGLKKGDPSTFADDAVGSEVFRRTVLQVHEQNLDLSAEEAMELANKAAVWAIAASLTRVYRAPALVSPVICLRFWIRYRCISSFLVILSSAGSFALGLP